jgi:hypothetical protein
MERKYKKSNRALQPYVEMLHDYITDREQEEMVALDA